MSLLYLRDDIKGAHSACIEEVIFGDNFLRTKRKLEIVVYQGLKYQREAIL